METHSEIAKKINTLVTKNNDLNAKFLSFSILAEGAVLQGILRKHADMHRFFSLQLVHDLKTYVPDFNLELNRTIANALEMGWEDIKASLGLENDKDLETQLAKDHKASIVLYKEILLILPEEMPKLKSLLEAHLSWHYKADEYLPEIDE